MPRKDSDLTSLVKEGADDLRNAVEKALAERPMLVLGLALELGLLAGHWVRGGKVSVLDVAKRALAASPQSFVAAMMSGGKKPRRATSRRSATSRRPPARRAPSRRKVKSSKPARRKGTTAAAI